MSAEQPKKTGVTRALQGEFQASTVFGPDATDIAAPTDDSQPSGRLSFLSRFVGSRWSAPLMFVIAVVIPFLNAGNYFISVLTSAAIFVMLCSGLNVVVGYCGLLDLGYVAFYAVGAYVSGILATRTGLNMFEAVPFVIVTCVVAGLVIGLPTLRLRSDYLAIVTLGFGEIIRITANNLTITGGPSGIYGIPNFGFGSFSFDDDLGIFPGRVIFYYFVIVVVTLAVLGAARLGRGRLGRAWLCVREDEDAAEAMGINTYHTKLAAYITGAIWGGLAGMLFAAQQTAVSSQSFLFLQSALILMAVVLGGMGSTPGIVLGGLFISIVPEVLRGAADWRYLSFGVLLIVMMIFRPQGLWPAPTAMRKGRRA